MASSISLLGLGFTMIGVGIFLILLSRRPKESGFKNRI
jgi:uncharacterized membrane protein